MKDQKEKQPFVLVGAKVPPDLRERIEKKAESDERTVSQTIYRLLSSHPELAEKNLAISS